MWGEFCGDWLPLLIYLSPSKSSCSLPPLTPCLEIYEAPLICGLVHNWYD